MARSESTSIRLKVETLKILHEAQLRLTAKVLKGEVTLRLGRVRTPSLDDTVVWLASRDEAERQRKRTYSKKGKRKSKTEEAVLHDGKDLLGDDQVVADQTSPSGLGGG